MYTCMCDWVTLLYSRKLTEYCKPAVMEKHKDHIKNINKYFLIQHPKKKKKERERLFVAWMNDKF